MHHGHTVSLAGVGRACMVWCAVKLPQKDALKSVHSRHTEKCALHAIADEALFILGVGSGMQGQHRVAGARGCETELLHF